MIHVIVTSDFKWGSGKTMQDAMEGAEILPQTKGFQHIILKEDDFEIGDMGRVWTPKDNVIFNSDWVENRLGDLLLLNDDDEIVERCADLLRDNESKYHNEKLADKFDEYIMDVQLQD